MTGASANPRIRTARGLTVRTQARQATMANARRALNVWRTRTATQAQKRYAAAAVTLAFEIHAEASAVAPAPKYRVPVDRVVPVTVLAHLFMAALARFHARPTA